MNSQSTGVGPPVLVYPHGTSERLTICTMSPLPPDNVFYTRNVADMSGKVIIGCARGWLILRGSHDGTIFSLFNPVTSETLHLPSLDFVSNTDVVDVCSLGFACDSICGDTDSVSIPCVVYLCFNSLGLVFSCQPTRPDCSWVAQIYELEGKIVEIIDLVILSSDTQMALFGVAASRREGQNNGWKRTYFTAGVAVAGNDNSLDTLKLSPLQIQDLYLDMYHESAPKYFVESCGRLYCVFMFINRIDDKIFAIKVGELDLPGNKWMEVESLDGRAFFLGHGHSCSTSTWCWADTYSTTSSTVCVKESCLYFWSPFESGETLYEYSMHDQSLTLICPCPNLASPHDAPLWLMTPQNRNNTRLSSFCEEGGREVVAVTMKINKQKDDDHDGAQESRLTERLPFHMTEYMSKYMHLFDFWSFRATCKVFRSAANTTPSWRTHNVFPLLMLFKNDGLCSLMDPFRHDSRSTILPQLLSQLPYRVVFSNKGYILTVAGKRALHFLNPFTGQSEKFSHTDGVSDCYSFAFSTCPTSPDCVTLGIFIIPNRCLEFNYIKQGDKSWNRWFFYHGVDFEFKPTSTTAPLFYQGSFYLLDAHGYLGEFSLVDGQPDWQLLGKADTNDTKFDSSYLVESSGKLCVVFIKVKGTGVQVFEFDNATTQKKWKEVKDLGNDVLFLSSASCFSVATSDANLRNRIYLPRLKGNDIVFYSMNTRMYHVSGSDEAMSDLYNTKEMMHRKCCWI